MTLWQRYRLVALSALLVLFTLVLLSASIGRDRDLTGPEKVIVEVLAPVQKGLMEAAGLVARVWRRYVFLVETDVENQRLRQELGRLNQELAAFRDAHLANGRLRRLLRLQSTFDLPTAAGEVIGFDPSGLYKTILVDKGSRDGVGRGMPVVGLGGVVGRVIRVSYNYSQALLITDRTSGVAALVQRTREKGVLKGGWGGKCQLEFVIRNADVKEGDQVITSGLAGLFPKGLVLGQVTKVEPSSAEGMFQSITVTPAVDFDHLEEALVILRPDPFLAGNAGGHD